MKHEEQLRLNTPENSFSATKSTRPYWKKWKGEKLFFILSVFFLLVTLTAKATSSDDGDISIDQGTYRIEGTAPYDIIEISDNMNITGGTVELVNGQVKFSNHPEVNITGDEASITMDRLNVNSTQSAVTFNFTFGNNGVSTVETNQWMTLSHITVNVDGSAYNGGEGTFELFKSNNMTHIGEIYLCGGFPGFNATFSKQNNNWVVTLSKALELPQAFLEIIPTDGQASIATNGTTNISAITDSKVPFIGSPWTTFEDDPNTAFNETIINDEKRAVFAVIEHDANGSSKRSFDMGIAKGGQVYSIRNGAGKEAVPPQHRDATNKKMAPWIDEAFQLVQVNIEKLYDKSTPKYFIHQAGTYLYVDHMEEPFYSPVLMSGQLDANTYVMANWAQQGHLDKNVGANVHQSKSIIYTKYRVVADGVIEITHLAYNFGADVLDFFNVPWGGVRMTTYPEVMLGDKTSDGSVSGEFYAEMPGYTNASSTLDIKNTGGWLLYASGKNNTDDAMALVFGKQFAVNGRNDVVRFGKAANNAAGVPETEWRNYNVTEVIRYQDLNEGQSMFARYYYVFGSVSEVKSLIDQYDLVEKTKVETISSFDQGPLYKWRRGSAGEMPTLSSNAPVHLELRNRPVNINFKPVFLIKYNNNYIPTYDPYKYTDGTPFKQTTQYVGLLGYADTTVYSESDLN
ncbi:hypothetical protein [Flammeovirga aprica]|uniref:Uncharacterized protein n=1 Tax=Flammeovirga aprica JL-4 TaxID=694437 RepID=A0A7X9RWQ7_9BACT|nr:hypothetical protein [Flammeovirga aprica]NME70142.1 hypothetical protein [Flammeovirga aprica JL-4]